MPNTSRQYPHSIPPDGLKLVSYCPLCNTRYNPLLAKVVEENDEAHLIHIECRNCGSSIVALVLTGTMGISSVGLVTDLTSEDVQRFKGGNEVTVDDVIDLHQILQGEEDWLAQLS
ncbi:MAG: hypothetical protein AAB733_03395 [Patescibacteria group bacterium]